MPNLASPKKELRKRSKRVARNRDAKAEIHSLRISVRKAMELQKAEDTAAAIPLLCKKLDKAVARGILKKNTVARLKSRAMKKWNATKKK